MAQENLYNKYRPQTWDDVVEQDAIKQILNREIQTNNLKHVLLFTGGAGTGKAQPLYSKILTPNGFITMGDVKLGDVVFTHTGQKAKVCGIYPQGVRPIYEITLQDGAKIRVSDNHLNYVYWYNTRKKCNEYFVYTTTELIQQIKHSRYKLRMTTPCVDFVSQDILIDPYLLGALLGDGGLSGGTPKFSNSEIDVIEKVDDILHRDYGMYLKRKNALLHDYTICYIQNPGHNGSCGNKGEHPLVRNYEYQKTLRGQLDYYGLRCKSVDKHIPKQYLYNTYDVRLKLLQGLYDTDGEKGGRTFTTSSQRLAEDVCFLMRSLGIRVTVKKHKSQYNGIICHDHYTLHVKPPKNMRIFSSKKHKENYKTQQCEPIRNIVSIDYIGDETCQCIMLDHKDHTYISDDFIATHNTTSARIFANMLEKEKSNIYEINCADHTGVDDVRQLILDPCRTKPLVGMYKIFVLDEAHMLTVQSQNALLKVLEEPPKHCIFIMCTTDPQKILSTILSRSFRYDFQLISNEGIINRLKYILQTEKNLSDSGCGVNTWDDSSLEAIASASKGHLRDSLTILQKCISYSPDINIDVVTKVLGVTNYGTLFDILDSILDNKQTILIESLKTLNSSGMDLKLFIKNFLTFVLDINKFLILKTETNDLSKANLNIPISYANRLTKYNVGHKDKLKHLLKVLLELNSSIRWETNVAPVLETNLLLETM